MFIINDLILLSSREIRNTNVNIFDSGTNIKIDNNYIIHLKKGRYDRFSLESSVLSCKTFKYIDPVFWPLYIVYFLHGDYKNNSKYQMGVRI